MTYKLGSLFDGSGGFPLAGSLCGIGPVWAAEVEPYPIAVTHSRFPSMKHLGDISKINGGEIEPVDIITFGSPCQDLSVAGKRAGLKHEANGDDETTRSGLFMEAVRIIKEMREATNGEYPSFALWENVPGAFSSNKGEDFRIVCEELIKIVEPGASMPEVPKNGWPYADSYIGDGWSLAYRVFDAQYWGVPQRRRRIHLIVDFRGERAREVLFEREGVRGYFAESRTPWQSIACDAQDCAGADDREGESAGDRGLDAVAFEPGIAAREGGHVYEGVSGTLRANAGDNRQAVAYTLKIRSGVAVDSSGKAAGKGALVQTEKAATLAATQDQYLFQPVPNLLLDDQGGQQISVRTDEKSPTLRAEAHGNVPAVVAYSMNTLTAGDRHAVAYLANGEEVTGTLCSGPAQRGFSGSQEIFNGGYHVIEERETKVFRQGGFADYVEGEVGTLRAAGGDYGGGTENLLVERPTVRYIVRRLTPTECARLQGFADRWGDITEKDSFTDEEFRFWHEVRNTHAAINGKKVQDYTEKQMLAWYNKLHTDSAEYKMWGNGIALPPALYCMQGIMDAFRKAEEDAWML